MTKATGATVHTRKASRMTYLIDVQNPLCNLFMNCISPADNAFLEQAGDLLLGITKRRGGRARNRGTIWHLALDRRL